MIPEANFHVELADKKLAGQLHKHLLKQMVPTVPNWNSYAHARETDSALIYKKPAFEKANNLAPEGGFLEKFLFYRGVGNFSLPLTLTAQADDRFDLINTGDQAIRGLFLVTMEEDKIRFQHYKEILPQQSLAMTQSPYEANQSDLASAIEAALVAEGLYEKEAKAMVNTWRDSWFYEPGTRLFYILPQSETEKLLPLEVKPAPDEMLRVMVGRMEIMRPEDEQKVSAIVRESLSRREPATTTEEEQPSSPAPVAEQESSPTELPAGLLELGRLAEPALVRVRGIATDEKIRAEAAKLLQELRIRRHRVANSEL